MMLALVGGAPTLSARTIEEVFGCSLTLSAVRPDMRHRS